MVLVWMGGSLGKGMVGWLGWDPSVGLLGWDPSVVLGWDLSVGYNGSPR